MKKNDIKEYYSQIQSQSIISVAHDILGDRITEETGDNLFCNCLNHASISKKSMHINGTNQSFYCFGCGVGGDLIQLVEFVQSGNITKGQSGAMPESHRVARDYLAKRIGLPSLIHYGLSDDQIMKIENNHAFEIRIYDCLTALSKTYHQRLVGNPDVFQWFSSRYAINESTVNLLSIGYADNTDIIKILTNPPHSFTLRDLASTGAFRPTSQDGLHPFFNNRITFPYWSSGRTVFMIGRKTDWTPDNQWEQGKYKKLPIYNEHQHPYIAKFIDNNILYNEDILKSNPTSLVITEGVTDCIALMERGFNALSPVTTRIKKEDIERVVPAIRKIKSLYICQDNEFSEAGLKGAMDTANMFDTFGIDARLALLPLGESQKKARNELALIYGLTVAMTAKDVKTAIAGKTEKEIKRVEFLLSAAKIDINEYFLNGGKSDAFELILESAHTPIEQIILSLSDNLDEKETIERIRAISPDIARKSPLQQDMLIKFIENNVGHNISTRSLRAEIAEAHRIFEMNKRGGAISGNDAISNANSCKSAVDQALFESQISGDSKSQDYKAGAVAAFKWFIEHGAKFFVNDSGESFMYYDNSIFWIDARSGGRRRKYLAMMFDHTGMIGVNTGGKAFFEIFSNITSLNAENKNQFMWMHSDIGRFTVYINLNNDDKQILKITPDSIEIMQNGGNPDGIILDNSKKMRPIKYMPDVDNHKAELLIKSLIIDNMTCPMPDRLFIVSWAVCCFLMDFSGTHPMLRFEGDSSSGKTMASKLISTLIYGEPQHKKSTSAANFSDGAQNPLVILDNIETRQLDDNLITFLLTSITGIVNEKRKSGTDTETVQERTKCLVITTGIEPIGGDLSEIMSRTFQIAFHKEYQTSDAFLEPSVISKIQENRDYILSSIFQITKSVLRLIRDGYQEKVMKLFSFIFGDHEKRRCNDYLSLMYLYILIGKERVEIDKYMTEMHPYFISQISTLNVLSSDTASGSNHIATAVSALFGAWTTMREMGPRYGLANSDEDRENEFVQKYQMRFSLMPDGHYMIEDAIASKLYVSLCSVARQFSLKFPFTSPMQFAKRLANDINVLESAGFIVEIKSARGNTKMYTIKQKEEQKNEPSRYDRGKIGVGVGKGGEGWEKTYSN